MHKGEEGAEELKAANLFYWGLSININNFAYLAQASITEVAHSIKLACGRRTWKPEASFCWSPSTKDTQELPLIAASDTNKVR